jgi:hypothetical protein
MVCVKQYREIFKTKANKWCATHEAAELTPIPFFDLLEESICRAMAAYAIILGFTHVIEHLTMNMVKKTDSFRTSL